VYALKSEGDEKVNIEALCAAILALIIMLIAVKIANKINNRLARYTVVALGLIVALTFPMTPFKNDLQTTAKAGEYFFFLGVTAAIVQRLRSRAKKPVPPNKAL
jgi:uncharacterized membrane protein